MPRIFASLGRSRVELKEHVRRASSGQTMTFGQPYKPDWSTERIVRDGYSRVTWAFRGTDVIASNLAKLPVIVRRDDPERGEPVPGHFLTQIMNQQPQPEPGVMDTAWAFKYRLVTQLILSTRGAFIEIIRAGGEPGGEPIGLALLPCHRVSPVPDPETFVSEFEVEVAYGRPERIPAADVLWIRKPHPLDPYRALTPFEAAGLTIDTDWYAKLYNRRFLQNDGRPGGILAVRGQMRPEVEAELKRRFGGGVREAGRVSVLNAGEVSFVDTAVTPRDAQWLEGRRSSKNEILAALGVGESLLGNASERAFANADAEVEVFWRETTPPYMSMIGGALDRLDGDPSLFTTFDTSGVAVLQKDRRDRERYALQEWLADTITLDEYREATGKDPVGGEHGGMFRTEWLNASRLPAGGGSPASPPNPSRQEPEPEPVDPNDPTEPRRRDQNRKSLAPAEAESMKAAADAMLSRWEALFSGAIVGFLRRQRQATLERMKGAKFREGTAWWSPPGDSEPVPGRAANKQRWEEELVADLEPLYQSAARDAVASAGARILGASELDEMAAWPMIQGTLAARKAKMRESVARMWDELSTAILLGAGAELDELLDEVDRMFGRWEEGRALTMAATEAHSTIEAATALTAQHGSGATRKVWLTVGDKNVRAAHAAADLQERAVGQAFEVGGELLEYPGDPAGSTENTVNCRCSALYEVG